MAAPTPTPSSAPPLKQPVMIALEPRGVSQPVLKAALDWEQQEHSSLFLMTCSQGESVTFSRLFVDRICAARSQFQGIQKLDVLLDHYGGNLDAAFQLVVFLRNRCELLRVFVPDFAKSASTLVTLGADEVWMTDYAEIGPLDAQIPDPHDPDRQMSALDEFRSVDYLRTHSFEILNEVGKTLKRTTSLPTKDRLRLSIDFTTQLMASMYSNVDPLHFGGSHRAVEMATEYGRRVMSRYAYRNWALRDINNLLRKLTWDYPSHGFVIDIVEAEELGLNVKLLDGELSSLAHTILDGVGAGCGFIGRQAPDAT
jgi:Serine dehydrogenase proteinase